MSGSLVDDEERVLTITFDDGSLLTVLGTSRGDDVRGVQEYMDIRRGHTTITIDDLWKMRVRSGGIERYYRTTFRNKSHARMYRKALGRVARGEAATYGPRDMVVVSAIQIAASDMVRADRTEGPIPSWLGDALRSASKTALRPSIRFENLAHRRWSVIPSERISATSSRSEFLGSPDLCSPHCPYESGSNPLARKPRSLKVKGKRTL